MSEGVEQEFGEYEEVKQLSEDRYLVSDGRWHLIDGDGEQLTGGHHEGRVFPDDPEYVELRTGSMWSLFTYDGERVTGGYHEISKLSENRFIGKTGAMSYLIDREQGQLSEGYHDIEPRLGGYSVKTGAWTGKLDKNGNLVSSPPAFREDSRRERMHRSKKSRRRELARGRGHSYDSNRETSAEKAGIQESVPDSPVNTLISGVEDHLTEKEDDRLYRAHVWLMNVRGPGKAIELDEDRTTSISVDLETFEELFSPFLGTDDLSMEYGGEISRDTEESIFAEILAENDVRPEPMVDDSHGREPEITAYDTREGIMYEGRMHLMTDTQKPYGEKPEDMVGEEDEEEFRIRVTLPYEEAAGLPDADDTEDVEETSVEAELFGTEVEYV